jgi:hypothetical protein
MAATADKSSVHSPIPILFPRGKGRRFRRGKIESERREWEVGRLSINFYMDALKQSHVMVKTTSSWPRSVLLVLYYCVNKPNIIRAKMR